MQTVPGTASGSLAFTARPMARRAAIPLAGVPSAHRTSCWPPSYAVQSTITVTPSVPSQTPGFQVPWPVGGTTQPDAAMARAAMAPRVAVRSVGTWCLSACGDRCRTRNCGTLGRCRAHVPLSTTD